MSANPQDVLVETDWLGQHATDPNVRIFEVDVDTAAYDQGHVAGAVGLNWKSDLQQHPVRDLLEKRQLEQLLGKYGVTSATTIVTYGDNNNWFAAWFFWLLKYYGHKDVKLVNGGRAKWIAEKRPLVTDVPTFGRGEYRAAGPDASIRALRGTRRSSTSAHPRSTRASCSRPRTSRRKARNAAATSPARRTSPGRPRSRRTAASSRPTSSARSTAARASIRGARRSPTAGSASGARTPGSS